MYFPQMSSKTLLIYITDNIVCVSRTNGPFTPSASTSVDGRKRAQSNRARFWAHLRPSTDVRTCWSSNGKRRCGTWQIHEYSIHKIMGRSPLWSR